MATVINTPASREVSDSGAAGWAVAVAVLLAIGLLALFVWPGIIRNSAIPTPADNGTNINVSLPDTSGGATGGTNTGSTGGTDTGATGGAGTVTQ